MPLDFNIKPLPVRMPEVVYESYVHVRQNNVCNSSTEQSHCRSHPALSLLSIPVTIAPKFRANSATARIRYTMVPVTRGPGMLIVELLFCWGSHCYCNTGGTVLVVVLP